MLSKKQKNTSSYSHWFFVVLALAVSGSDFLAVYWAHRFFGLTDWC